MAKCNICQGSGKLCARCGEPPRVCRCSPSQRDWQDCEGCDGEGKFANEELSIDDANRSEGDADKDVEIDL